MRTDKFIILGLASMLTLSSCSDSFLEVQKPDGDPLEDYYTTPEHIEEAVIAAYDPIHWHDWGLGQYNAYNIDSEIMGDDFWVGGSSYTDMQHWHMLGNYEADENNTLSTLWTIDYSGVKRSNDVLHYLPNAELTEDYRKSCEMQARCLRVFYYNNLWHLFGNIPFYLENLGEPPYTATQISADEVYEQLIAELEEIIDSKVLPIKWQSGQEGRVSQAFAIMLYAEMVGYQNDATRFSKAYTLLKEQLIGSNQYALFPDFKGYWDTENEWNEESIWEINYDQTISECDWGSGQSIGGMVIPTLISPNNYKGDSDWAAGEDGWGFMTVRLKVADELLKGDGRLEGTVWDLRDAWNESGGTLYVQRDADTHLWLQKYRPYSKNNANGTSSKNLNYANNFRYYRYSEALLYAAEFAIRSGVDAAGTGEAKTWVNMVRNRANLSGLASVNLNDIFTERHKEFVGEGKRYFDLVRAEDIPEVGKENKATGVLVPANNADEGVSANAATRTNSWTPKKKYIPIAQAEIDSDPNIKQNDYK